MRLHLGIASHRVEVAGREDAALAWLREFLAPAFCEVAVEPGSECPRVRFLVSPARHAKRSRAMAHATTRTLEGFTRDGSFSLHPAWRDDDGWTWAHEEDGDAFLGVAAGGRDVTVLVREDATRPRVALMRVVRELATIALLRDGWAPLHASAFTLDGRAVLVCGARRAGKTSVLLHGLHAGAGFLSNDRVFARADAPPEVRAMPTIVQLRNGTLERFDAFARAFERARYDRGRTLAECAPGVARVFPSASPGRDRPGITPAQLCRLLDAPIHGDAPLGAILFPRVDPHVTGVRLEPLDPDRAGTQLAQNLLAPSSPVRHAALFAPDAANELLAPDRLAEQCGRLAAQADAFVCRLGPDAFATDLGEILRRAIGARRASRDAGRDAAASAGDPPRGATPST